MVRQISARGRLKIMMREGCKLEAYPDPATGGAPWTIGTGHTGSVNGVPVRKGMRITQAMSDAILANDLLRFEVAVSSIKGADKLSQNQYDACGSLAFEIGADAFVHSTVATRIGQGDMKGAANAFMLWTKAHVDGKLVEVQGIVNRRKSEVLQFQTPDGATLDVVQPLPTASKEAPQPLPLPAQHPTIAPPLVSLLDGLADWVRRMFDHDPHVALAGAASPPRA